MKILNRKTLTIIGLLSTTSLVGLFSLVNPDEKPIIFIFIPVVFIWISLFSAAELIQITFFKKNTRLSTIVTFVIVSFIVMLFLLSGIGQLTVRDLLLTSILAIISAFYFYRSWA